jgi:hypothetical protein
MEHHAEDAAQLLESKGNFLSLVVTGIREHREMLGANFYPSGGSMERVKEDKKERND